VEQTDLVVTEVLVRHVVAVRELEGVVEDEGSVAKRFGRSWNAVNVRSLERWGEGKSEAGRSEATTEANGFRIGSA